MNAVIRGLLLLCGMLFAAQGFAAAVVETATGDVKAGATAPAAVAVARNQRVEAGTTVVTGAKSLAILRFDDGQAVVVNENSEFRLTEYSFVRGDPAKDKSVFDLFKGAARFVSGLIASRQPAAALVRVPQATIGIRGTDYMVALVNPAYISVIQGAIATTNAAGTVAFAAGATGTVASATTLAASIAASALPAGVAGSFSTMSSVAVAGAGAAGAGAGTGTGATGAGTGAAGAGAATGAAAGGITVGTVAVAGAVAAAVVATTAQTTTATGTTGSTGTTGTQ